MLIILNLNWLAFTYNIKNDFGSRKFIWENAIFAELIFANGYFWFISGRNFRESGTCDKFRGIYFREFGANSRKFLFAEISSLKVENNDGPFKLLQSDLDELKLPNPTLVLDGATADQTLWLSKQQLTVKEYWIPTWNSIMLTSTLIKMTKKAVKNLDLLKDLPVWKYLHLWSCFKTEVPFDQEQVAFQFVISTKITWSLQSSLKWGATGLP